jgi:hypothetical protein
VANEETSPRRPAQIHNSTHLPSITRRHLESLDLQDELQTRYTGGTVIHLFLGERVVDTEVVKKLVRNIANNYKLPYFSITPTFSVCPTHGYVGGEHHKCPHCGAESEVYSRVVGYLRPVAQWKRRQNRRSSRSARCSSSRGHRKPEARRRVPTFILRPPSSHPAKRGLGSLSRRPDRIQRRPPSPRRTALCVMD